MSKLLILSACFLMTTKTVFAAESSTQGLNISAIVIFVLFLLATLWISYWASQKTKTSSEFYTAGGHITAGQNGTAIAGDFISAASFLGISGLIFTAGYDGLILAIGALSGWPILLFLMSERVRNLGKYTLTDVIAYRLQKRPIRLVATLGTVSVIIFYLIAQMVGAGKLVELLFGISYNVSVTIVGILVIIYVTAGGMLSTTWVQIIKAILLMTGAALMCLLLLYSLGFSLDDLFSKAVDIHPKGVAILQPGSLFSDPIQAITIAVSMMFGILGLPHILMRLFTVPDMQTAKKSVFVASVFMGFFYLMTILIGFASIVFVTGDPQYYSEGNLIGGSNVAAIHLAHKLGGDLLMGFMSAVAFSTILAVVAGLTVAGSAAVAHDIYAELLSNGKPDPAKELLISKVTVIALCCIAVLLGILFQKQNVAFIAVMPLVISASVNFPILILAIYWRGLTTRGAVVGGLVGFVSSIALIVGGPKVWVSIIGADAPLFPYDYPALFTMSASFICIYIFSVLDKSRDAENDREKFTGLLERAELGTNISASKSH